MRINILLTFDYELPLGGIDRSYSHSLFEPTDELLLCAEELKVPIVLFADILSFSCFKKYNINDYFIPFKEQLQQALKHGHDVQLHIHPHWLETVIKNDSFIPSGKFTFADFSDNIEDIIKLAVSELNDICSLASADYKCIAFRSGGYNLSPCTSEILNAIYNAGIRIDSSVAKGYYFASDISEVDYRYMPDKPNYYLSLSGKLNETSGDGIYELPIASKPKGFFELPTSLKLKFNKDKAPESRGKMIHVTNKTSFHQKLNQLFSSRMLTVDNYTYSSKYLQKILDYNVKKYSDYEEISLCLIGHPKAMGKYSFQLLKDFVSYARKKYENSVYFCTYPDILKRL